jgi:hypothetical protein
MENEASTSPDPSPPVPSRRPARTGDALGAVALLCIHIALALVMGFIASFLAMGTDACAYQACGDEKWVTRAISTAWLGGITAVVLDVVVTCVLLARHRPASWVPVMGCLMQLGIGFIVVQMASIGGPVR